ncbi:hypothetical protein [Peptostreptococcus equinus]|uniref:Multimeric flavodoxin WrbA n=1 Tax=Peptostreptococcus equinus TaxID=3003601 RepID=A0ABY7JM13_9FIRM|nr:hypothetical protein [Peptostreptococcus sp. CBA3647]WAW14194.1 hypothetical protein O0R46_06175 [Peptostreptococcus sp. CBA3647]
MELLILENECKKHLYCDLLKESILYDSKYDFDANIEATKHYNNANLNNKTIIYAENILPCTGCVSCWFRTPGKCILNDKANSYASNLTKYDKVTIVSELKFGTFSFPIKRLIDRCVGYLGTFMDIVGDDIRHEKRYEHSFSLDIIFYGQVKDKEMQIAKEQVKAMCKNYYIKDYKIEFLNIKNQVNKHFVVNKNSELDEMNYINFIYNNFFLNDYNNIKEYLSISRNFLANTFDNDPICIQEKTLIINASPRANNAVSKFYAKYLKDKIKNSNLINWSFDKCISVEEIIELLGYKSIIFCYGLYVDNMPSNLLENINRINAFINSCIYINSSQKNNEELISYLKSKNIYAVANNGLKHGKENELSLLSMELFSNNSNLNWVMGLGIGAGPLYANSKENIFDKDYALPVKEALNTLQKAICSYNIKENYNNIYTDGYIELNEYKEMLNKIWKIQLSKSINNTKK